MSEFKKAFFSVIAGMLTATFAISISFILDKFINDNYSTFLGLFIAMFINFIMQQLIFVGNLKKKGYYFIKYVLADVIILGSNQLLVNYFITNKDKFKKYMPNYFKKYYNSICRLLVGGIIWVIFSFPLRRYWVFIN